MHKSIQGTEKDDRTDMLRAKLSLVREKTGGETKATFNYSWVILDTLVDVK